MDLPLAKLDRIDASIVETSEGFQVVGASGARWGAFSFPVDPAAIASDRAEKTPVPGIAAQHAIRALAEVDHAITTLERDKRLSEYGREERFAEPREAAVKTIVAAHEMLKTNLEGVATQEARHYAVPQIDPTNFARVLADFEIRQYARGLRGARQGELHQVLGKGENEALTLAILRSPIPFGNYEKTALLGWRARIDQQDPVFPEEMKIAHMSIDWAQRIVHAAQGYMMPKLKIPRDQLFGIVGERGAPYFRFSAMEMANFNRRKVAAEARAA